MAGLWRRTLVYLGLMEDDEFEDYAYEERGDDGSDAFADIVDYPPEPRRRQEERTPGRVPTPEPLGVVPCTDRGCAPDADRRVGNPAASTS